MLFEKQEDEFVRFVGAYIAFDTSHYPVKHVISVCKRCIEECLPVMCKCESVLAVK